MLSSRLPAIPTFARCSSVGSLRPRPLRVSRCRIRLRLRRRRRRCRWTDLSRPPLTVCHRCSVRGDAGRSLPARTCPRVDERHSHRARRRCRGRRLRRCISADRLRARDRGDDCDHPFSLSLRRTDTVCRDDTCRADGRRCCREPASTASRSSRAPQLPGSCSRSRAPPSSSP